MFHCIFDFGCVKEIQPDFYTAYFTLIDREIYNDEKRVRDIYRALEMIHEMDSEAEIKFFFPLFKKMVDMLTEPFTREEFDFGDPKYFQDIYTYIDEISNMKEVKESAKARGSRHSLYINRTYYGLYHILSDLKSVVKTKTRIQG